MKRMKFLGLFLLLLVAGCAGLTQINNASLFEEVHRAYRLALRDSDFKAAGLVLDPAIKKAAAIDYQKYKDFKVVRYKVIKSNLSDKGSEIHQEVEIQYYHQNRPVVKTMYDNQTWQYQPDPSNWYLLTGLPELN